MARVKVAVIGAGSYVFGPSILNQILQEHKLDAIELALVDLDGEVLELMAGVARRMARESGLNATLVTTHTDREQALDGAAFVVCSASPQMQKRFAMDREIIEDYLPGHLVTEFGGIAGISYSLRQIALIEAITDDMKRLCPDAWLLNVANPLPRVCQAAHENGIRTAGFCSVSIQGYGMLERIFEEKSIGYPFEAAQEKWQATMAGVNHFSWLIALEDKATRTDALPELRKRLEEGTTSGNPRAEAIMRETGYLLMPGDNHTRDFLTPAGEPGLTSMSHGSRDERQRRLKLMRAIGEGSEPYGELLAHPSWEKPGDFIAAIAFGKPAFFGSLNLINNGQIPTLPDHVFVETACEADAEGPKSHSVALPKTVDAYCRDTARVTDTIVRAARERSLALLHEAVDLDPTILDKTAGKQAINACVQAHAELLPKYA